MAQTDETRSAGLTLTITRAAAGDERTLLYGYASVLVRGDADAYWVPSTEAGGGYTTLPSITQMSWPLGKATGDPVRTPSGVWTRQYEGVWVAVNPTGGSVSVTAPTGARAANGSAAGTVSLGAYSAVLLRMS
jgi:hypothetical protein